MPDNKEEELQSYLFEVGGGSYEPDDSKEADTNNCVEVHYRDIYQGGFPNCAATVEDGSWCGSNDACTSDAIRYQGMENCFASDCNKALK